MEHECLVLILAQHLIDEGAGGHPLVRQHLFRAPAGIDDKANCQRQIRLAREVFDLLQPPVFLQDKVFFVQVADNLAVAVADGGEHIDDFDVGGECGRRRVLTAQEIPDSQTGECSNEIATFHLQSRTFYTVVRLPS